MPKKILMEITPAHRKELERHARKASMPLKTTMEAILEWAFSRLKAGEAQVHRPKVQEAE